MDPRSKIAQNEAFAPVSVLYTVDIDDEVAEIANGRPGGLSASVYMKSFERGLEISKLLEFDQIQVNEHTMHFLPSTSVTGWKGNECGSNAGRRA